jgi:hypothetical protein
MGLWSLALDAVPVQLAQIVRGAGEQPFAFGRGQAEPGTPGLACFRPVGTAVRAALGWLRTAREQRLRPVGWARCVAVKGRREGWIPASGEMRAACCCVVAWCWSACGLLARPARRGLEAAEERVQAGGEPFVAVIGPDVLAQGGQRREPVGWQ